MLLASNGLIQLSLANAPRQRPLLTVHPGQHGKGVEGSATSRPHRDVRPGLLVACLLKGAGRRRARTGLAIAWNLRLRVWKARLGRYWEYHSRKALQGLPELPDLDLNVLPPVLPQRRANSSVTKKVWRKIVYWAKVRDQMSNRLSYLNGNPEALKVTVLGGGAFGTAMATHVARKGHNVMMVVRNKSVCKYMNRRHINPKYLSEFKLPETIKATTSAVEALVGCDVIIHAVPVQASRQVLESVKELVPPGVPVVAVSKGIELGSRKLMCDVIPEALGRDPANSQVVVVSGPSFAKEIMDRRPTSVVAAARNLEAAEKVSRLLTSKYFRVSMTDDIVGVEVAGALKNVLAIAAGIVEGLSLGTNAMSALVTQGNAEIRWLATAMGAKPETLAGLSGMGDILLTCFGSLSRNRSVGVRLGKGDPFEDVISGKKGVAEGVYTARLVVELADEYKVLLPVLTTVARILSREVSPREAVFQVLALPPWTESA
ncbi:unnamed protein product [Effrenium voratum]|nr:unnamed protein product [Effrenium voratum]